MKILALDTASEACSAALLINNEYLQEYTETPRQHANLLLPMVDNLLKQADITLKAIDAIAFNKGPGAFTGVRIASAAAQGLAFGADLPVIPISSLATLAQTARYQWPVDKFLIAVDAKMQEVYWASYTFVDNKAILYQQELLIAPEKTPEIAGDNWLGIGTGWISFPQLSIKYKNTIQGYYNLLPQAKAVAQLASYAYQANNIYPAEQALPVYLREEVTQKPNPINQ